jgi:hypothetical protein
MRKKSSVCPCRCCREFRREFKPWAYLRRQPRKKAGRKA